MVVGCRRGYLLPVHSTVVECRGRLVMQCNKHRPTVQGYSAVFVASRRIHNEARKVLCPSKAA